jgi:two-component sensor histidine kinase
MTAAPRIAQAPVRVHLAAEPRSVTRARHTAGDYATSLGADRRSVEVFVSEAVTNAITHAFRDQEPGRITLDMQATFQDQLLLSVSDDGVGIRPDLHNRGLGFGFALMGAMASSVSIEGATSGGTRVVARFPLGCAHVVA